MESAHAWSSDEVSPSYRPDVERVWLDGFERGRWEAQREIAASAAAQVESLKEQLEDEHLMELDGALEAQRGKYERLRERAVVDAVQAALRE